MAENMFNVIEQLTKGLPFSVANYPVLAARTAGEWVHTDDELLGRLIGVADELHELGEAAPDDDELIHYDVAWYVVRSLRLLGYLRYDWVWPVIVEKALGIAIAMGDPDDVMTCHTASRIIAITKKAQRKAYGVGQDTSITHALWENHTHRTLRDLLTDALALCIAYGLKREVSPEQGMQNNIEKLSGVNGRHRLPDGTIAFQPGAR